MSRNWFSRGGERAAGTIAEDFQPEQMLAEQYYRNDPKFRQSRDQGIPPMWLYHGV
jgi:hypothetical protein